MFNLPDHVYDFLSKFQRWLPTIGVLYLGLCHIWGLGFGDEVNQTIAVIATFLASYLEICTGQYLKSQSADERPTDEVNEDIVSHEDVDGVG